MGRRTIIILIVVVALLALLAVAYFAITGGGGGDTPVTEGEVLVSDGLAEVAPSIEEVTPVPTSMPTDTVYVSLQTVPRGFQYPLTAEELLTGELVRQERRTIAEGESLNSNFIIDIEDIVGKYARNRIFQGETLTMDALASDPTLTGVENYGPSSLIPYGSVAAAIPMDRLSSVAYALDEGDHVDIMITFLFYQIDEEFQTYLRNAGVFFVQESLQAAESTGGAGDAAAAGGEGATTQDIFVISPYGRFEQLPTGDLAHISPSEPQRPIPISMILQNAKVIQVGEWKPQAFAQLPTPVPPAAEGEATPSPTPQVTPIPNPPEVLVLALSPQQQLLVKYAVESFANFDFALRGANDGQLYSIDNVDLDFILQRFGIDVPLNFGYSVDPAPDATATPAAAGQGE